MELQNKWVKCDGYWKEIYDTLIEMGYKSNCSPHELCWGYWVGPHGVSQLSEGGSVVYEKERVVYNHETKSFSPYIESEEMEVPDVHIRFYDNICQVVHKGDCIAFDIFKPYKIVWDNNYTKIMADVTYTLYSENNKQARYISEFIANEILNSRVNDLKFNK